MPADSHLLPPHTAAASVAPTSSTLHATTASATAITRSLANQAPSRPTSSIPPAHHIHYPPQALYTGQPIPIRAPSQQLPKPQQDASQGVLYPVASSGRGFIPRPIRPLPTDQTVTVANPGGYSHLPVVTFPHRPVGSPHLDSPSLPMHMTRPPNLQQPLHPDPGSANSGSIKGVSGSSDPKVLPPSSACESNGCKEMRDKVRDDTLCVVRDRKVRITDGASLYALCRSWLKNGSQEESQPQYGNFLKSLPRPLPIPVANAIQSEKKEVEEEDEGKEDKESIEQLSPKELLSRHVQRAKKVRSRLREERSQRIERYKTRLALLLPPQVEQLRTDNVAGVV